MSSPAQSASAPAATEATAPVAPSIAAPGMISAQQADEIDALLANLPAFPDISAPMDPNFDLVDTSALLLEREAITAERIAIAAERQAMTVERLSYTEQLSLFTAERQAVQQEKELLKKERENLDKDREELISVLVLGEAERLEKLREEVDLKLQEQQSSLKRQEAEREELEKMKASNLKMLKKLQALKASVGDESNSAPASAAQEAGSSQPSRKALGGKNLAALGMKRPVQPTDVDSDSAAQDAGSSQPARKSFGGKNLAALGRKKPVQQTAKKSVILARTHPDYSLVETQPASTSNVSDADPVEEDEESVNWGDTETALQPPSSSASDASSSPNSPAEGEFVTEKSPDVFCVCNKPHDKYGEGMIQCDAEVHSPECVAHGHWYHPSCLSLEADTAQRFNRRGEKWFCQDCTEYQDFRGLDQQQKEDEINAKCAACRTHTRSRKWTVCSEQMPNTSCAEHLGFWHDNCAEIVDESFEKGSENWICPQCKGPEADEGNDTTDDGSEYGDGAADEDGESRQHSTKPWAVKQPIPTPQPAPKKNNQKRKRSETEDQEVEDQPATKRRAGAWSPEEESGVVSTMEDVITGTIVLPNGKRAWGDQRFELTASTCRAQGVSSRSGKAIRMNWIKKLRERSRVDERDYDEKHPDGGASRRRTANPVVGSGRTLGQ